MSNPNNLDKYHNARDSVYSDLKVYLDREPTEEEIEEELEEIK